MSEPRRLDVLIVDDEPVARQYLEDLLAAEPDVQVVGRCANGNEAATWLERQRADVMLLDVRMPGIDGVALLERLDPSRRPEAIVFVTAYADYAVKAFEQQAIDYLLKPFDRKRLTEMLARVRQRLKAADTVELGRQLTALLERAGRDAPLQRIPVRQGRDTVLVATRDLFWIEAEANYARLHLQRESHLIRATLTELEERLDPRHFARVHRGALVNLDRVAKLTAIGRGDGRITLSDGRTLTLSRRYREALEQRLGL